MKKPLNNLELAYFSRQLSLLLKSGISLLEGISILRDDAATEDGKAVLNEVYEELLATGSIREALEKAGVFPPYLIHMTELGELSGNLDDTFASLGEHYQREDELSRSIRGSLTYPLIMLGMLFAVLLVLILKVMPVFEEVFRELGAEMGGAAGSLLRLGTVLRRYSLVFLVLLLLIAAAVLWFACTKKGRKAFGSFCQNFPPTRSLMETIARARFASGMSIALQSGLDTEAGFDLVSRLVENRDFQAKIEEARGLIQNGEDFSDALAKARIFSGMDARMVSIGFKAGAADTVLIQIAERLQDDTEDRLQSLAGILEPTLVAVLSILVGMILLSVMLPLVGIMSGIG